MIPTLTAIIPTVGRSSLKSAVLSALTQRGVVTNVIVIDDSLTQSVNIQLDNVQILRTGGAKGVSFARNIGIRASSSQFIAFLDDDDFWTPHKSEYQIKRMLDSGIKVSLTSVKFNRGSVSKIRPSLLLSPDASPLENLYGRHFLFSNHVYLAMATLIVEKSILLDLSFDETLFERENLDFLEKLYLNGMRIHQYPFVGAVINYTSKGSLSRMSLRSELDWLNRLHEHSRTVQNNFCLESARNFLRTLEFESSIEMINKITNPSVEQRVYGFLYNCASTIGKIGVNLINKKV